VAFAQVKCHNAKLLDLCDKLAAVLVLLYEKRMLQQIF